jgi:TetR/AcrR family transcriptional regulator, fatty acid metabolism regulator protein
MMIHAKRQKRSIVIDKRKEILTAAIDIFARRGYVGASIKDVADKAGVATGTVYLYFKNKDDLLLQSMKTMMDSNLVEIKKKIANVEPSIDKLFMFFYHHVEVFTKKPSMARFLVVELRQSEEFYKRHPSYNPYHDYADLVKDMVRKAIQEGTTQAYKPETISYLILGAMDAVLTQWLVNPEAVDLETVVKEIQVVLHNGMKKRK